ncbi:MAG: ATP-grasp domain-containing protein [Pirellulales bacterium]
MSYQDTQRLVCQESLLVVGASTRSVAQSAARIGRNVHTADLFCDEDLRMVAASTSKVHSDDYPHAFLGIAKELPSTEFCYTGGLENYPAIIDRLQEYHRLAGNSGTIIQAIRDPFNLAIIMRDAHVRFPDSHHSPEGLPLDGSFLAKQRNSTGGRHVTSWNAHTPSNSSTFWQKRIFGTPYAASFIMHHGQANILGISQQLLGYSQNSHFPFAYHGSLTLQEDDVPPKLRQITQKCGALLAQQCGLLGAVGADFVVDQNGEPWMIEVNPRFTASMELHERTTQQSIVGQHLDACRKDPRLARMQGGSPHHQNWIKTVLYTTSSFLVDKRIHAIWKNYQERWSTVDGGYPALADIPIVDQTIRKGSPILTLFAKGCCPTEAITNLQQRLSALREHMRFISLPAGVASFPKHPDRCTA